MEYTVQKLGRLAGISTRTLRYYDEIGILKPARINSSGYRIYGQEEVNQLRDFVLPGARTSIGRYQRDYDLTILQPDQGAPRTPCPAPRQRRQLDLLITNVENTIASAEGRITMSDQEKFEGFKQKLIDDNEKKYGKEIREKYGDEIVNKSNAQLKNMTQEQHEEVTRLADELYETLAEAFKQGDPASELAQKAADLHKRWLTYYWNDYSKEAHAGLAQMYVDDERFTAHYDEATWNGGIPPRCDSGLYGHELFIINRLVG